LSEKIGSKRIGEGIELLFFLRKRAENSLNLWVKGRISPWRGDPRALYKNLFIERDSQTLEDTGVGLQKKH
jgi:hypothetical protein